MDYPAGNLIRAITSADFNGDGIVDVAAISECSEPIARPAGLINIYLGRGTAHWYQRHP